MDLDHPDSTVRERAFSNLEKRTREKKSDLEEVRATLFAHTQLVEAWPIRLHLVRILPRLTWSDGEYPSVRAFMFGEAEGSNLFIRAWALDGLARLSISDEEIRPKVISMLLEAVGSGSASVRVRAKRGLARLSSI